jgi:hypothetical protein
MEGIPKIPEAINLRKRRYSGKKKKYKKAKSGC